MFGIILLIGLWNVSKIMIKAINDINNGYTLYKELEDKIDRIKLIIKDLDNIPTSVINEIIDENTEG